MKTVLIIAYECAPYHRSGSTIGAQRPFQFAKHFPKFGWKAIVLCSEYSTRYSTAPATSWEQAVITLVRTKLDSHDSQGSLIVPLPSLSFADYFDRLWLKSVNIGENGTFQSKPGIGQLLRRKIASFVKLFRGDHSQAWQPVALAAAKEVIKATKVDFILAEHGPDASIHVGRQLHHMFKLPWCVDFRDPVLRFYKSHSKPFMKLLYRHYLRSCTFLTNVHKHWAYLDEHDFGRPSFIITNGFDPDEFTETDEKGDDRSDTALRLFYGGNINFKYQSLDVLFRAIADLNEVGKRVEFTYIGNGQAAVHELAAMSGISVNVTSLAMMARSDYLKMVKAADILVILSFVDASDRFFEKGLYPGKVFEYFALQKPIICVPGDNGLLDELLEEVRVGKSFSDYIALRDYLSEAIECKLNGRRVTYRVSGRIGKYSRERQAEVLAKHLDRFCDRVV